MVPSAEDLLRAGPLLVFALAAAETAVPAGLLVPAGVALATAAGLAHAGYMPWEGILVAAVAGALMGDSLGYWLGRRGGLLLYRLPGLPGRLFVRAERQAATLFHSHSLAAVTGGRLISFVRTLMPPTAGISGISYPRFLLFDLPGVGGWLLLYVALGTGAAEGARRLMEGTLHLGGVLVGAVLVAGWLLLRRTRRMMRPATGAHEGSASSSGTGPEPDGAGVPPSQGPSGRALRVGLTGNVASGKSTVARVWEEMGVPVVSSDELARQVVAPGTPGLEEVIDAFGKEVRRSDGTLDRAALRARVFGSDQERRRLEAILHPRIARLRERWEAAREEEGHPVVVSEVPLLFEAGLAGEFDRVVVVHASASERRRRLVQGRGLDPGEADRVMAAQGDPEEKRAEADHVLVNEGTKEELASMARQLMERLRTRVSSGAPGNGTEVGEEQ